MKKQWISVKCGLSRDPKHRQSMGESVWLFLHILDVASWDDGIAHDWKDEAAAEDMGMPVRTLREHRRKLSELGYITCLQKQYTQDIVIHNWTNPREYTGQTYNKKQGDSETEPEEKAQGYTQGYTQGSRKDVTPTLDSNNKESIGDLELQAITEQANRKVDAILGITEWAGAKREARVSAIQSYLGETFHRNTETKEWLKFAKFIDDKQQNSGEDVKVFVAWLLGQKNYDPQFWPVSKMMEFWPSAFVSVQSPQRPELEKYTPDDPTQFVPRPK